MIPLYTTVTPVEHTQGEPLDNYDAVLAALETMQDKQCFGISVRLLTILRLCVCLCVCVCV
jgi:hypothetical protein